MWTIDEEKTKELGLLLEDLRKQNKLQLKQVSSLTKIDVGQLYRLEKGTVYRINALMLRSLAALYEVDVIMFYKIIDYI